MAVCSLSRWRDRNEDRVVCSPFGGAGLCRWHPGCQHRRGQLDQSTVDGGGNIGAGGATHQRRCARGNRDSSRERRHHEIYETRTVFNRGAVPGGGAIQHQPDARRLPRSTANYLELRAMKKLLNLILILLAGSCLAGVLPPPGVQTSDLAGYVRTGTDADV